MSNIEAGEWVQTLWQRLNQKFQWKWFYFSPNCIGAPKVFATSTGTKFLVDCVEQKFGLMTYCVASNTVSVLKNMSFSDILEWLGWSLIFYVQDNIPDIFHCGAEGHKKHPLYSHKNDMKMKNGRDTKNLFWTPDKQLSLKQQAIRICFRNKIMKTLHVTMVLPV